MCTSNLSQIIEVLSQIDSTPVTVNGRLVYPGDSDYPQSKANVQKATRKPADLIPDNSTEVKDDTKKCLESQQVPEQSKSNDRYFAG